MNQEERNKIKQEIKMIMTEKDEHNRYIRGDLTLQQLNNIIISIFYVKSPPNDLSYFIERCWDDTIKLIKNDIMMNGLEESLNSLSVSDDSLLHSLTNLNLR